MKIRDILGGGRQNLQTVTPDNSVRDAVRVLNDYNIGALPVCVGGKKLVGIISERDVLRQAARDDSASSLDGTVESIMSKDLVIGLPDDDLDYVMRVMTERRVRHLPVLDHDQLVGIISIGDVVKAKHEESETEVRYLRDYLAGAMA